MANYFQGKASKLTLKALILAALSLFLLIPLSIIENITEEREVRQSAAYNEFMSQFGKPQIIDVVYAANYTYGGKSKRYYFEPSSVSVDGNIKHKQLKRGRFDVLTYSNALTVNTECNLPKSVGVNEPTQNQTNDGKKSEDKPTSVASYTLDTASVSMIVFNTYNSSIISEKPVKNGGEKFNISQKVDINGVGSFKFVTRTNFNMTLKGDWPTPSFTAGDILPLERDVQDDSFKARWSSTKLSEPFVYSSFSEYFLPQMPSSGVELLMGVSQYQMTTRTLKYGLLVIVLTFVVFLLSELWFKQTMNVFQYILAGLALTLFYSLLLSISEHTRFIYAYIIATAMTSGLIFLYMKSVLGRTKAAVAIVSLLLSLYIFIYILTQLEEFSLISGSIGLFFILSLIMYSSQRIITRKEADTNEQPNI